MDISKIDHEYITGVVAYYKLSIGNDEVTDPLGSYIYLHNIMQKQFSNSKINI